MELTTHTPKGVDKVKRYGWTIQDRPGELRHLHKDVLRIHPAYQRELIQQKVTEISAAWSWVAMGALVVGERGGEFWVIDGQHRACAAKRRSDITHLPCVVFQTNDVQEEARGFLTIQTMRKPVSSVAKQKAMVAAGDEVALFVQATCDALGLEIRPYATSAGQIKCIAWCHSRASEDKDAFREVLGLGAELCTADNMHVAERLLEGLWVLHARCGEGLADKRLVRRLREKGARRLLDGIARAVAYHVSGGGKIWAQGMLSELNKGLQHKFRAEGLDA